MGSNPFPRNTRYTTPTVIAIQPSARSREPRQSRSTPAAHTTTTTGPSVSSWSVMYFVVGFSLRTRAFWPRRNEMLGQPCATCQARLGAAIATATRPPSHGQGVRNSRRIGVRSTPAPRPATRVGVVNLVSIPRPIAAPSTSHQRGLPDRTIRTNAYNASAHANVSNDTVWSKPFAPRKNAHVVTPSAASHCARGGPPSSLAIAAVKSTTATPAANAGARRPTSELPNSACARRAITGVTGGKSTYPSARWCAATA